MIKQHSPSPPDPAVSTAHQYLVVADVNGGDAVLGLLQGLHGLDPLGLDVPASHGAVQRPAHREGGVLVESDTIDGAGVAAVFAHGRAGAHFPHDDGLVHPAGQQLGVVAGAAGVEDLIAERGDGKCS